MPIEPHSPSSTGSSRAVVEMRALDAHPSAPTWMLVASLGSAMVSLSSSQIRPIQVSSVKWSSHWASLGTMPSLMLSSEASSVTVSKIGCCLALRM